MDASARLDECPATEDCPGFDRERRACLLRREDCDFAPHDGEAAPPLETSGASATALTLEA